MKKMYLLLVMCVLFTAAACAEVIPPQGISEDYRAFTGISAREGVVLCQSLTVRDHPSARAIDTLYYGDRFMDLGDGFDGFLHIGYQDGQKEGWVDQRYVAVDPGWYITDEATPAYAWGHGDAPRVALLDKGERLPILHETEGYYVVSLRGASAWIEKEAPAQVLQEKASFAGITSATLRYMEDGKEVSARMLTDAFSLEVLSNLLTDAAEVGFATKCPFGRRVLDVVCEDGTRCTLDMAADDCRVFRLNGVYWEYGASREGIYSDILFSLFE